MTTDRVDRELASHTLTHLFGCFVCKSQSEDRSRGDTSRDHLCDSLGERMSLAGAGACEDQEWAISMVDGFGLSWVEHTKKDAGSILDIFFFARVIRYGPSSQRSQSCRLYIGHVAGHGSCPAESTL